MRLLPVLMFFMVSQYSFSQKKIEIGIEAGVTNDRYVITDMAGHMQHGFSMGAGAGINLRYNTSRQFFFEAGAFFRESGLGFSFKPVAYSSGRNLDELLVFPLKAGHYFLISGKLSVAPTLGIVPVYQVFNSEPGGNGVVYGHSNSVSYSYATTDENSRFNLLIHGGISLELLVLKKFIIALYPNYNHGFFKVNTTHVDYILTTQQSSTMATATMEGYGSYMAYNIGLRYLLLR